MARIFISSTTEDLRDYRAEAVRALRTLGHKVVVLEELEASSKPPVEQSFAAIDSSDLEAEGHDDRRVDGRGYQRLEPGEELIKKALERRWAW